MKKAVVVSFVYLMAQTLWAGAPELPPLGARDYILDPQRPFSPSLIQPRGAEAVPSGASRMRDPIPLGTKPIKTKKPELLQAEAPKKVSRMVFDRVMVNGRYLVPRVTFERSTLPSDRREVPVKVDYRQRIRDSESVLRDFEW
jgi:hypothetical protein